jgi:hypothetical protein
MGGSRFRAQFPAGPASLPLPRAGCAFSCCHEAPVSRCPSAWSSTATLRAARVAWTSTRLRDSRRYQVVREQDAVRERTVEITFLEPGAAAYAFTSG